MYSSRPSWGQSGRESGRSRCKKSETDEKKSERVSMRKRRQTRRQRKGRNPAAPQRKALWMAGMARQEGVSDHMLVLAPGHQVEHASQDHQHVRRVRPPRPCSAQCSCCSECSCSERWACPPWCRCNPARGERRVRSSSSSSAPLSSSKRARPRQDGEGGGGGCFTAGEDRIYNQRPDSGGDVQHRPVAAAGESSRTRSLR